MNDSAKFLINEYQNRINKVLDYIEKDISKDFTLEELANIACFSKFHFHRIFSSLTGESLFQFIQRIRLEKACSLLKSYLDKSISDIAYQCGFSNSSSFAKAFKEYAGISASKYRRNNKSNLGQTDSNIKKIKSNFMKEILVESMYIDYNNNSIIWRISMDNQKRIVEVKELPKITLAYIRYVGPYKGDDKLFQTLFAKLMKWAGPRGLINFPETKSIIVYHDDPEITEQSKLRTSVCISVPDDTKVGGEVGKMEIGNGKYALARFELLPTEFQEAWDWVCGTWLPQSGYQPDDGPCFEWYHNDPKDHPENRFVCDICIPVKPM